VAIGRLVQFERLPEDGVPKTGVTSVGLVDKTTEPEPVEVVTPVPPLATGTTPDTTEGEIFTKSVPLNTREQRSLAASTTPVCPVALNVTVYVPEVLRTT
jgi:hypothetical protein